jgi:hypothetical protein
MDQRQTGQIQTYTRLFGLDLYLVIYRKANATTGDLGFVARYLWRDEWAG